MCVDLLCVLQESSAYGGPIQALNRVVSLIMFTSFWTYSPNVAPILYILALYYHTLEWVRGWTHGKARGYRNGGKRQFRSGFCFTLLKQQLGGYTMCTSLAVLKMGTILGYKQFILVGGGCGPVTSTNYLLHTCGGLSCTHSSQCPFSHISFL